MADMDSMNREVKKRQLRRQMVSSEFGSRPVRKTEESAEIIRQGKRKIRRRRLILAAILLILAGAGTGIWFYYQRTYQFTSYEVKWEIPINEGSLVGYESFGNNVLRYTKDGASYMDNSGKAVWTESYEMKSPIISVNGDYAAIGDRQGNSILICHKDGTQGRATTVLPISNVTVSGSGVVAAVLEDSTSSYITFFRKDGTSLDITVKTNMGGDGYPFDIALSENGTQLLCSFVYLQSGELKTRVVFYDFSEIGKNVPNRLVGGFDEPFQGTMVGRVEFLADPYSCAFSGNGLTFFSSKNLASPEMVVQIPVEEEIESVLSSKEYAGMIIKNNTGEFPHRLEIYKKNGDLVLKKDFQYEYTRADIDGDLVILSNEDSCKIFNMAGVEKLNTTFDFAVSKIRKGGLPGTLVVTGPQVMKEIHLQ